MIRPRVSCRASFSHPSASVRNLPQFFDFLPQFFAIFRNFSRISANFFSVFRNLPQFPTVFCNFPPRFAVFAHGRKSYRPLGRFARLPQRHRGPRHHNKCGPARGGGHAPQLQAPTADPQSPDSPGGPTQTALGKGARRAQTCSGAHWAASVHLCLRMIRGCGPRPRKDTGTETQVREVRAWGEDRQIWSQAIRQLQGGP